MGRAAAPRSERGKKTKPERAPQDDANAREKRPRAEGERAGRQREREEKAGDKRTHDRGALEKRRGESQRIGAKTVGAREEGV
jgi:hypothetical protein